MTGILSHEGLWKLWKISMARSAAILGAFRKIAKSDYWLRHVPLPVSASNCPSA
jgi:hypothetical protein